MSFKFIPSTNTELTAADAATLASIPAGNFFKGQTKKTAFQIGNTGSSTATFDVTVAGGESAITDNVTYSLDGETWSSSVGISGVAANGVTDLIRVRYTPDSDDFTTSGTFLIQVTES